MAKLLHHFQPPRLFHPTRLLCFGDFSSPPPAYSNPPSIRHQRVPEHHTSFSQHDSKNFNTLKTITTQKDQQPTFKQFKDTLDAFEENEHSSMKGESAMKIEAPVMSKNLIKLHVIYIKREAIKLMNVNNLRDGVAYANQKLMTQKYGERGKTL